MTATRASILLAISLGLVLSGASAAAAPLFRKPAPVGDAFQWLANPGHLVKADFNGDGFPDVAAYQTIGRIAVALNDGVSPFAPAKLTTAPAQIGAMAAGDFNADGKQDLVYVRSSTLGVFLGNGDGTFTAGAAGQPTAAGPLAVGDLNADGKLDVVAATPTQFAFDTPYLSIHFGNGAGGFAEGITVTMAGDMLVSEVVIAKLNGDAMDDVIVSGVHTMAYVSTGSGLELKGTYPQGNAAVGRFNADAIVDLAVCDTVDEPLLRLFLGNGDGTFTANGTQYSTGDRIAAADFDNDNLTDIVSAGSGITVSRGTGTGSFTEPLLTLTLVYGSFVTGDFDRDGSNDLVFGSLFLHGNGDGTFRDDRGYFTRFAYGVRSVGVSAADMNGDGHADATTLLRTLEGTTTDIAVLRNDTTGKLLPATFTATADLGTAKAFLTGRINGDAAQDALVIATSGGVMSAKAFLGNGNATFTPSSSRTLTTFNSTTVVPKLADVTGDGAVDLLIGSQIYEGNGDGSFDAARSVSASFNVVGDVDGNGTLDAIWSFGGQLAVALNSGGGTFGVPAIVGSGAGAPAVLADFDGDDVPDILSISDTKTRVYRGHGNGTFKAPVEMDVSDTWWSSNRPVTADFDADGNLDVAFGVFVLFGNGDGRFRRVDTEHYFAPVATADFDGNGKPDLLTASESVFFLHLTGLVPEPATDSATIMAPLTAPQHATPTTYRVTVTGTKAPVEGYVVYTNSDLPIAIATLSSPEAGPPGKTSGTISLVLPVGTHSITATYLGSATHRPSSSSSTVTVDRATTSLTSSGPYTPEYGSAFTLDWVLTAMTDPSMPAPSAAYSISEGGVPLADVEWSEDSVLIRGLSAGTHTLTLKYEGDDHYKPATAQWTFEIYKRQALLAFDYLPAGAARVAGPVTLAVTLSAPVDYGTTTGSVEFIINQQSAGTAPLTANHAELTVQLPAGGHILEMKYSGDANTGALSQVAQLPVYLPVGTPVPVIATATATNVQLFWTPVGGAPSYLIYQRSTYAGTWQLVTTITNLYRVNLSMTAGTTRMYAIAPKYEDGTIGPIGPPDIATKVAFTDDPVVPGTPIRAAHVTQLRTAVNAVRTFAGLTGFSFTDTTLAGTAPRAVHLTELRTALTQARNAIGMPIAFSPQAPAAGVTILSTHIEEIRAGVR
jgi:hypothetical protein